MFSTQTLFWVFVSVIVVFAWSGWAGSSDSDEDSRGDECRSNPCVYGTCTNINKGFVCNCHPGFTGPFCTENIDDCAGDPCQNGGRCVDLIQNYTCCCPDGFTGMNCSETPPNACPDPYSVPQDLGLCVLFVQNPGETQADAKMACPNDGALLEENNDNTAWINAQIPPATCIWLRDSEPQGGGTCDARCTNSIVSVSCDTVLGYICVKEM